MSATATATPVEANLAATNILNHKHPAVKLVVAQLTSSLPTPRAFVQAAHRYLGEKMKAVYSIDEDRPVSETRAVPESHERPPERGPRGAQRRPD